MFRVTAAAHLESDTMGVNNDGVARLASEMMRVVIESPNRCCHTRLGYG